MKIERIFEDGEEIAHTTHKNQGEHGESQLHFNKGETEAFGSAHLFDDEQQKEERLAVLTLKILEEHDLHKKQELIDEQKKIEKELKLKKAA